MKYFLFIVLLVAVIITAGCTVEKADCNGVKYDLGSQRCCGSTIYTLKTADLCCNGTLYDRTNKSCCNEVVYDTKNQDCCYGNTYVNATVYNTNNRGCCNGVIYDKTAEGCCKSKTVYSTTNQHCCDGKVGTGGGTTWRDCAGQCYDYTTQSCCNKTIYNINTQACCNGMTEIREGSCCAGSPNYNLGTPYCNPDTGNYEYDPGCSNKPGAPGAISCDEKKIWKDRPDLALNRINEQIIHGSY